MPTAEELFAQAVAQHQAGQLPVAESLYRQAIGLAPDYAEAHGNLGVVLARANRLDEAVWHYQTALRLKPSYAEAYFNLGNVMRRVGRPTDAVACYQQALVHQPQNASAHCNLGLAYSDLRQADRAVACFQQAMLCDPQFVEAHQLLGNALQRAGRAAEAVASFERYTQLRPDDLRGYNNLGLALLWSGRVDESVAVLRQTVQRKPEYAEAHNNLGLALEAQGAPDGSVAAFAAAAYYAPNFAEAHNNLGNAYTEQGRTEEAVSSFRRAIALQPQAAHLHSNMLLTLNYLPTLDPTDLLNEHLAWARQHLPAISPAPFTNDRTPGRKLRIGYLSADFRQHTVPSFIEPVLAAHDRTQFEVIGYANVARPDAVTERLKNYTDRWRNLSGIPDDRAAQTIREDGVDLLIDLGGHTASNRLLLMAHKPAPVQATLFGYPNTTAVPAVDYRISDPQADPPNQTERFYTEKIFRLPEVAWCYLPGASPEVGELPALSAGQVCFGSLNNLAKVNAEVIALWSQVLHAVPGSRLFLMRGRASQGVERVVSLFDSHGIAADRLELIARLPKEEYFRLHGQLDLCLDPFPYNGGITTCDALWMGVPVITLAGNSYVSRQGVSLLTHLQLPQFIAHSPAEYVEIAARYAQDLPALSEIRRRLRARMQASRLVDSAGYTRQLEAAYRAMWTTWCESPG